MQRPITRLLCLEKEKKARVLYTCKCKRQISSHHKKRVGSHHRDLHFAQEIAVYETYGIKEGIPAGSTATTAQKPSENVKLCFANHFPLIASRLAMQNVF